MKRTTVMYGLIFMLISAIFLFSGCTDPNTSQYADIEERFLGSWRQTINNQDEIIFNFFENGVYNTSWTIPGTWEIIDEDTVELTINDDTIEYEYSFSENDQILTLKPVGMGWSYTLDKIG